MIGTLTELAQKNDRSALKVYVTRRVSSKASTPILVPSEAK